MENKNLTVALLGFGVVGSGTAEVITENQDRIRRATGRGIDIRYILDLREFPDSPFGDRVVHDINIILDDPEVDAVVEMMGGSHPAVDFTRAALSAGKHVVTSNKEVVAKFGTELLALAKENGVRYLFEASVGGGIPVLRPLAQDLASNRVRAIDGILNGTTNYILTRMFGEGTSYDDALGEAQARGYAERDPSADVDGHDAARKIVILTAVATGCRVSPDEISIQGIRDITDADVALATELGYTIKLIAHMDLGESGRPSVWVAPCFVPVGHPLHAINDVFNGILIHTDMLGQTLFYGRGAGKLPTAGAVVSDLTDIALHEAPQPSGTPWSDMAISELVPADEVPYDACLIYEGNALTELPAGAEAVVSNDAGTALLYRGVTAAQLEEILSGSRAPKTIYRCLSF